MEAALVFVLCYYQNQFIKSYCEEKNVEHLEGKWEWSKEEAGSLYSLLNNQFTP